jgi:hypothetical protein
MNQYKPCLQDPTTEPNCEDAETSYSEACCYYPTLYFYEYRGISMKIWYALHHYAYSMSCPSHSPLLITLKILRDKCWETLYYISFSSSALLLRWTAGVRFPTGATVFSLLHSVQTAYGAHYSPSPMGTAGSFPGRKAV